MKDRILAGTALMTISLGAQAQSSVTLYGVADTAVEFVNHMAGSVPTVNSSTGALTVQPGGNRVGLVGSGGQSGSRWGIRGSEDLGNQLKAIFVLESGFTMDEGKSQQGGRLFGRAAYVGLKHNTLGALTFGRQYSELYEAFANFAPLSYAPTYDPSGFLTGQASRQDNTVKYVGTLGPITAAAHYSFGVGAGSLGVVSLASSGSGEVPGHGRDNTAYGASVSYAAGPFGMTVTYDQWNPAVTTGNAASAKKAGAAMSYAVGPVVLFAGYRWARNATASGLTLQRDDFYWLGANYNVTKALALKLGYYYDDLKTVRIVPAAAATNPKNPWQVSIVADYSFSKRTDVYLATAYAKNAALNFDGTSTGYASSYYLAPGATNQFGAAVGIRHKF